MRTISFRTAFLLACGLQLSEAGYPLNQTCSPPAAQGGKGYCGPSFCDTSASPYGPCIFPSSGTFDYPLLVSKLESKVCTQSVDPRCTSAALAALMVGQGIKAAYCNDLYLVLQSDGTPGFQTQLLSIKNPPAASVDGTTCVTRYVNKGYMTAKIPLYPTLLSTSDPSINNLNIMAFPNGASGSLDAAYMSTTVSGTGATYGLPTRGDNIISRICNRALSRLTENPNASFEECTAP